MKLFIRILPVLLLLGFATGLLALQRQDFYRPGPGADQSDEKSEFTFSRLHFVSVRSYGAYATYLGYYGSGGWNEDYPKADRQFVEGLGRLTRLDDRATEEVVDLDSDDIFNWPWVYAVNVGTWGFTDSQAKRMREYLQKGGFLMVDSFHGEADWANFMSGMNQILPNATVEDLPNSDEIFHVLYDLDQRFQIPGYQYMGTGRTYEKDGFDPKWRAIRDDHGRIIVAICHNMHLGDAWEHADNPLWPERFSSLAYRLGINYIMYAMTH
jgi:hypothetical protein